MYSRQATGSVNCEKSSSAFPSWSTVRTSTCGQESVGFSNKICSLCLVVITFQFVSQNLCNRSSFCCAGSSIKGMCVFITLGTNSGLDCPATTSLPVLSWQESHCSPHFCDCSVNTQLINRNNELWEEQFRSFPGQRNSVLKIFTHLCFQALFWLIDSWIGILGVCFLPMSTSPALQFCPILFVDFLHQ